MTALWLSSEQQTIRPISDNNLTRKFNRLAEVTLIKDLKPLIGYAPH